MTHLKTEGFYRKRLTLIALLGACLLCPAYAGEERDTRIISRALETVQGGDATERSEIDYNYPVEHLKEGQSFGNQHCYATLNANSDMSGSEGPARFGLWDSMNQKSYLLGWEVSIATKQGDALIPTTTTFAPVSQKTEMTFQDVSVDKAFFLPIESGYLRSAHFLLSAKTGTDAALLIRTRLSLPSGSEISEGDHKGHKYLVVHYSDGDVSVLWGSGDLQSFQVQRAEVQEPVNVTAEFAWTPNSSTREFALSFAYALAGGTDAQSMLLDGLVFGLSVPDSPTPEAHLLRIHELLGNSIKAVQRYLDATRLWTPDSLINRGYSWAKVNQLREQQEFKWGYGFSNSPPSDIVVNRDSAWYLLGSTYYAQAWSRKLLDLLFKHGLDLNGKFTEYSSASLSAMESDDYGLNINDDTPLVMIAAYQYMALTGDRGFLQAAYPSLLRSANYIVSQTKVGSNNHYGLVWCDSTQLGSRGECTWRAVIAGYNIAGGETEVNSECYRALLLTAELAKEMGDESNRTRLETEAINLRGAIQRYLRASEPSNRFYYLNISPTGTPVADMTADMIFPVLFGVSDKPTGRAIIRELFSDQFWVSNHDGAGGIRTISSSQPDYRAKPLPDVDYGLLGGVWPNLALWVAKAAAVQGLPDLAVKGMSATFLLSEPRDPVHLNVVPGEYAEYFNGDDLVQRGMPLSPFIPGMFIWSGLEGLFGISPHSAGLLVEPHLPKGWKYMAVSQMPYRGNPLTMLANPAEHTLYTTSPVKTSWHQVVVSGPLQEKFRFDSDKPAFWLVVSRGKGTELFAAAAEDTSGKLIEINTGRVIAQVQIPARELIRQQL